MDGTTGDVGGTTGAPRVPTALPGVGVLLRSAWRRFAERWKMLVGLSLVPLPVIVGAVFLMVLLSLLVPLLVPLVMVLAVVAILVVGISVNAGIVYAVANEVSLPFRTAFRWGWKRCLSVIGVNLLLLRVSLPLFLFAMLGIGLIVGGALLEAVRRSTIGPVHGWSSGFGSLSVLLIGLGIVLSLAVMAFSFFLWIRPLFAPVLVILAETTVFRSLGESWRLTKGRFWSVLWRFFAVTFLLGIIQLVVQLLLKITSLGVGVSGSGLVVRIVLVILSIVMSFIFGLLMAVYIVVLLRAVQAVRGSSSAVRASGASLPSAT